MATDSTIHPRWKFSALFYYHHYFFHSCLLPPGRLLILTESHSSCDYFQVSGLLLVCLFLLNNANPESVVLKIMCVLVCGTRMLFLTLPLNMHLPKHCRSILNPLFTGIYIKLQDISKPTFILSKKERKDEKEKYKGWMGAWSQFL